MFTISQVAASTPYDDTVTALGADNVQDAIELLAGLISDFASEEYVADAASNLLPFYLYSDASDIATYLVMKEGVPPGGGFGIPITGVIDGDLISAFASEPGVPGITAITSGVYKLRAQARQDAGTKTSKIYFEIYKRVLAGTETLLGTSSDSDVLTGSNAEKICHIVFPSPITFLSTDRIVVKIRTRVSGAGTAPDVTVDIQGVNFSRFEWPASVLAAAMAYADTVGATAWKLSGNSGTSGTSVVGTTDAQPWTTIAGGVFVDSYAIDGSVSSILNITQPDTTQFMQKRNQVNLSLAASSTATNFLNQSNSVGYASAFDYLGAISSVSGGVDNGSPNTVSFISSYEGNINLHGGGTTNLVKGINMNAGVSGATVDYWTGVGSYMNMTSGSTGQGRAFEAGWSIDDSNGQSWDLFGGNLNVTGTSSLSQNAQAFSGSVTLFDTANANQVIAVNAGVQVRDTATAGGVSGMNLNTQVQDGAVITNTIFGTSQNVTASGTSTASSLSGYQLNIQVQDTSNTGGTVGANIGLSQQNASVTSSSTAVNVNHQFQGTSSTVNSTIMALASNVQDSATMGSHTGLQVSPQISGTATVTNFNPFQVNANVQNTAVITNPVTLASLSLQSTPTLSGATGINLNLTGAPVSDAMQKYCINAQGGLNNFQYDFTVPPAAGFLSVHAFSSNMTIDLGSPISSLGFVNNFGASLVAHDDWTADFTGIRIGWTTYAAIAQLAVDAGKTIDSFSGVLSALNDVASAGTIDQAFMFRAGGVIPGGGAPTVNLEVGFQAMPTMGTFSGGNCWAFRDDTSSAENYLGKLAIGSASKKVTNSDVALEIGNSKAFLNGSGSTATRTALTALAGMQFYDTDLSQLLWYDGVSWVLAGAGTAQTDAQEQPAGTIDGANVTFTLANIPVAAASVALYLNGLIQYQGTDYTIAADTITMTVAPVSPQTLYAVYRF